VEYAYYFLGKNYTLVFGENSKILETKNVFGNLIAGSRKEIFKKSMYKSIRNWKDSSFYKFDVILTVHRR